MSYDLEAIRRKLRESSGGQFRDPDEFRPTNATSTTEPLKWRFFVLPPLLAGATCKTGKITKPMDMFYVSDGQHWVNNKPYACPRIILGDTCKLCDHGFALLKEIPKEEKDRRQEVIRRFMPNQNYIVNIYFLDEKTNPEDLRDKVKFYKATKSSFDQWSGCLNREDAGDPREPLAHGVFFDETAAYVYQLEALKNGKNNGYKSSKFLANAGRMAIAKTPADIDRILGQRIDLYTKVGKPDPKVIDQLVSHLLDGDDFDVPTTSTFDEDETLHPAERPAEQPAAKSAKSAPKAASKTASAQKTSVSESIADEIPFDVRDASTTTESTAAQTATLEADPVSTDEIEALLSRLD